MNSAQGFHTTLFALTEGKQARGEGGEGAAVPQLLALTRPLTLPVQVRTWLDETVTW